MLHRAVETITVHLIQAIKKVSFSLQSRGSLIFSGLCFPAKVKNFGRSGRTKYTHLVDQDTTSFDSAWAQESAQNTKFFKQKAAGVRDVFDRPTVKKRKT